MKSLLIFWLLLFLATLLLESITPGLFFFLAFAFGALVSAGALVLGYNFNIQVLVFAVSSLIFFVLLRYLIRYSSFFKTTNSQKTNFYALIGKQGIVVIPVTAFKKGYVRIDGELWSATVEEPVSLQPGGIIEVVAVRGAHVVVRKIDTTKE